MQSGKVLARSDLFAGGGVIPLLLGPEQNTGCRCLKEADLQPERSLSSLLQAEVFLSRGGRGSWSAGSLKGETYFLALVVSAMRAWSQSAQCFVKDDVTVWEFLTVCTLMLVKPEDATIWNQDRRS